MKNEFITQELRRRGHSSPETVELQSFPAIDKYGGIMQDIDKQLGALSKQIGQTMGKAKRLSKSMNITMYEEHYLNSVISTLTSMGKDINEWTGVAQRLDQNFHMLNDQQ